MNFLYPGFLWALFVLAIPLALHLFNFRRYKKVMFSNVEMLKRIETESRKSRQIKKWLVLLSRILALIALVFAFAQAFIPTENHLNEHTFNAIYIDNSYSMYAEGESGQLFEQAKETARELLKAYPPETEFQIITNSPDYHREILSRESALKAIEDIKQNSESNDISSAFKQAWQLKNDKNYEALHFYAISDFQKNRQNETIEADSNTVVHLIYLHPEKVQNLAIDSAWLNAPVSKAGESIDLRLKIRNHGTEPLESSTITMSINGMQQGAQSFSIDANSTLEMNMPFSTVQTGWLEGKLSINDYPLSFDNDYYFALEVLPYINILQLSENNDSPFRRIFDNDPAFQFKNLRSLDLDYGKLEDYDFIILHQLPEISSGLAQELYRFAQEGGVILLIPSTERTDYSTLYQISALPEYGDVQAKDLSISTKDLERPFLKGVYKSIPKNSFLPTIKKIYNIQRPHRAGYEAILQLKDGSVVLGSMSSGQGMIFQSGLPLNMDWSNFHDHELFVTVVLKMAFSKRLIPEIAYPLDYKNPIRLRHKAKEAALTLRNKDREIIVEKSHSSTEFRFWLNPEIKDADIYTVAYRGASESLAKIALNNPRNESGQQYHSEDELQSLFKNTVVKFIDSKPSVLKYVAGMTENGKPLWKVFIVICLIFLLIEILLLRFLKS